MRMLRTSLFAASGLTLLALAACREERSAIAVPDPAPPAYLSEAALPYAPPAPVSRYGPDRGYEWADRAYWQQAAYEDVPPDYGFSYEERGSLAWETADAWAMYAEPWEDEGYAYYYYAPGAAYPYFVRDGRYGYGFDAAGVLVTLVDMSGVYLPRERFYEVAPLAGRYYVRGKDLRNAARQSRRWELSRADWDGRRPKLAEADRRWRTAAESQPDWRAWRARSGDAERRRFLQRAEREDHRDRRSPAIAAADPRPGARAFEREGKQPLQHADNRGRADRERHEMRDDRGRRPQAVAAVEPHPDARRPPARVEARAPDRERKDARAENPRPRREAKSTGAAAEPRRAHEARQDRQPDRGQQAQAPSRDREAGAAGAHGREAAAHERSRTEARPQRDPPRKAKAEPHDGGGGGHGEKGPGRGGGKD